MNVSLLNMYKSLINFLTIVLSDPYEIILYWTDDGETYYIAEIENSTISGRSENSPLTEYGLTLIRDEVYKEKDYVTHFKSITTHNIPLTSFSYFIKDDDENLLGILGINYDNSKDLSAIHKLEEIKSYIFERSNSLSENDNKEKSETLTAPQLLTDEIDKIIYNMVSPDVLRQGISLSQELKIDIVRELHQRGLFSIKGAVSKVSDLLNVSEPSIYRYLKIVNDKTS